MRLTVRSVTAGANVRLSWSWFVNVPTFLRLLPNCWALTCKHTYTWWLSFFFFFFFFWPFGAARHSSIHLSLSSVQDLDWISTKRDNLQVFSVQRLKLSCVSVQILNLKHLSHCQKVYTTNSECILMSCPSWLKSLRDLSKSQTASNFTERNVCKVFCQSETFYWLLSLPSTASTTPDLFTQPGCWWYQH